MSEVLIALIVIGLFIGLVIVTGVPIWLGFKIKDWRYDHRDKMFKSTYPKIYKIYHNYWKVHRELEDENDELNKAYRNNCERIEQLNQLLPTIPNDSNKYLESNNEKHSLQEQNLSILNNLEENKNVMSEIYTVEYQLAEAFYMNYLHEYSEDLK